MSIFQKIGLLWFQHLDVNGYIFNNIRTLSIYVRIPFYIFLVFSVYFSIKFIGTFIDFSKFNLSAVMLLVLALTGKVILFLSTLLTALIATYEFIYHLDPKDELLKKKEALKEIKAKKLQWWRLRNMNFFFRALFYIVIYIAISKYLQISSFVAFIHVKDFSEIAYQTLKHDTEIVIQIYTFIFVVSSIFLELLVRKTISKRALK